MRPRAVILLALSLAACAGKTAPTDDFSQLDALDPKSDAFHSHWRLVGTLKYDTTSKPTSYSDPPRYRAFKFSGKTGDAIVVDVHSDDGDTVAWVLDSKYKTLASNDDASARTTDSHIELTLPKSSSTTHYVVVRDYYYDRMTFTVALKGPSSSPPPVPAPTLTLVSARDHIEGAFLTERAIYADASRIYLASIAGDQLFVLARDRAADFPLLQTVSVGAKLSGVTGDGQRVFVSAADGKLHVFDGGSTPLEEVAAYPVDSLPLGQVTMGGAAAYVTRFQGVVAVGAGRLFVSELNPGEGAIAVDAATGALGPSYDQFETGATVAYDLSTGARLASVPNPLDNQGRPGTIALYADDTMLAQSTPGCCGNGVLIYDPKTLQLTTTIVHSWVNTVARRGSFLVAGNEGGQVDVFDLAQSGAPPVADADLRLLTGHTGSEDIEIRSLWVDGLDDLVFAGSSWGNDQSRGPTLPSFFVLELK